MSVNGLIQGCLTIMRFNYGAGKQTRVKSAFRYGTAYASIIMLPRTLVLAIIPTHLLSTFAASENMPEFGKNAMRIMSVGYLFCGFTTMIVTYFQAIDRVIESNILQLMRQLIVLLPTMWVLNHTAYDLQQKVKKQAALPQFSFLPHAKAMNIFIYPLIS